MAIRVPISDFGVIQKLLAGATVSIFIAEDDGTNSGTLATLYEAETGTVQRANPQTLDSEGKLEDICYVETPVVAEISNLSDLAERQLKKIKQNPTDYALPSTTASLRAVNTVGGVEAAAASAAAAAGSAAAAATSAETATTQASTATAQAGIATTAATNASTSASEATMAAAAAQAAAAGQKLKSPARAATTAALPTCTYANGASGVGATLTADANGALPAQDGITLLVGEVLLVKNQASALQNGVYTVTGAGSAGSAWVLTRTTDSDTWTEIVAALITVTEGTTLSSTQFLCTSASGGTMGTDDITWQASNATIADGAVSTAAKIVDGIITYAKMASSAIATLQNIVDSAADKIMSVAVFKTYFTDWQTATGVTVTECGTVSGQSWKMRREGKNLHLTGAWTSGSPTGNALRFTPPTGLSIDYASIPSTPSKAVVGQCYWQGSNTGTIPVIVDPAAGTNYFNLALSTQSQGFLTAAAANSFGSGRQFYVDLIVPIQGW